MIDGDLECVKVFSGRGNFFFDFGSGVFLDLIGIVVDSINNVVFVCNGSSNVIVVFKFDGEVIFEIEIFDEFLYVVFFFIVKSLIVCFYNTLFFKIFFNKEF